MRFDKGYLSPYMITNAERMETEYDDIRILVLTPGHIGEEAAVLFVKFSLFTLGFRDRLAEPCHDVTDGNELEVPVRHRSSVRISQQGTDPYVGVVP